MAKLGSDWIFIGLGIGALYFIYKNTSKLSTTVEKTTDVVNPILDSAGLASKTLFETIPQKVAQFITGYEEPATFKPTLFEQKFNEGKALSPSNAVTALDLYAKSVPAEVQLKAASAPQNVAKTSSFVSQLKTLSQQPSQTTGFDVKKATVSMPTNAAQFVTQVQTSKLNAVESATSNLLKNIPTVAKTQPIPTKSIVFIK